MEDDFLWSSLIGGDDGDSGGLGFHDDLAEGVGGGGEGEEVARGVEGGEFFAVLEAEEVGVVLLEAFLHFLAVWAVADDNELRGLVGFGFDALFDARPVVGEDGEVFFGGDSAAEEEFESGFGDTEWFPDGGVSE